VNSPWRDNGAFIPFPKPIDAITDDPNASADFGICLAMAWEPAVLGALKTLTRPETWQGSDADIATACRNAYAILEAVQEPCSANVALLPFACPGDLTANSAPYGVWSLGFVGQYIATQGYGPTLAPSGSYWYYGEWINIDLNAVYDVRNVHIEFDYLKGSTVDGTFAAFNVVDVDRNVAIGPTLSFNDLPGVGYNQGFNSGAPAGPLQHISVRQYTDTNTIPAPTGNNRIFRIDISGKFPSGGPTPC
jgi:hypothetical protein